MRKLVHGCMVFSALCLADAAAAQDAPNDLARSEIVVTGRKDMDERIRDLIGSLTESPRIDQLGRFEVQGVCPTVLGLVERQKQELIARMRRVAENVGIPVAGANCIPNVIVVVADDKRRFIEQLDRRRPSWFVSLSTPAVRRLARGSAPAAAWHVEGRLNADGLDLGTYDYYWGRVVNQTPRAPSRITAPTRPHFEGAVVVVEMSALKGLTITQLADYAAMRVFAPTDPSRLEVPFDSTILRILDAPRGTAVPVTLTHWDLGLLRGLYAARDNLYVGAQRSAIRKQIEEELQRHPDPQD